MLASDFMVCIPLMMVYMLGLGPVFRILRAQRTCLECGAHIARAKLPMAAPTAAATEK